MISLTSLCSFSKKRVSSHPKRRRSFGASTITGWKPGVNDWTNQDTYFVQEEEEEDDKLNDLTNNETNTGSKQRRRRSFYAVLDGHGSNGHSVSNFCRERLLQLLSQNNFDFDDAFSQMQEKLESSEMDIDCSGTTCTVITISNLGEIEVANVGDSRAMLMRRCAETGKLSPVTLTYEHNPDKPEEVQRIKSSGGMVYAKKVKVNTSKNNENKNVTESATIGPVRVWYRKSSECMMGLAMTRSFGDLLAHRVGVSHEPFVRRESIQDTDECIVLASDGVWDVFTNDDITSTMEQYISKQKSEWWDPQKATNFLMKKSRDRWIHSNASYVDDITCCVINLRQFVEYAAKTVS